MPKEIKILDSTIAADAERYRVAVAAELLREAGFVEQEFSEWIEGPTDTPIA